MNPELRKTIEELIAHTTGGLDDFNEDAFYRTLEHDAQEYDWQKKLCRLIDRLDDHIRNT